MKLQLFLFFFFLFFSFFVLADLRFGYIYPGTMVCESKNRMEIFLNIKKREGARTITGCLKEIKRKNVKVEINYQNNGYSKVLFTDGKIGYVENKSIRK